MAADKIRIKDVAELAGVSVGTVDRVIHNRPNVSKTAREKVEKALKEMDYHPNMYASALAYNKKYNFDFIIPKHESEAYWEEIEEGAMSACEHRRDFNINMKMMYYNRFDKNTFVQVTEQCLKDRPDGVIIVPTTLDVMREFTDILHDQDIPFILLDSYMPDLKPLSFYGQDSFFSGYFAGRMLMLLAAKENEIMLMKQMKNGNVASKQQENRETGFRHYMRDHFPEVKITEVNLPLNKEREQYDDILDTFFKEHPHVHHCITFNSKAHLVGEFLQKSNRRNVQIMGYDMVNKNAECVKQGSISFLIAQHAYMQGFSCIETLFEAIVLKKEVTPINYMPIEILTKENVDFYRRQQL
ncbi:MAG: substrate-binding domain-containing protein [Prevotella sp.]|uniref:LacI family DNA-binding transcriptional regulator n=1 Tax=Prevotella sp. PTAC TaxID=2736295 RepID=UPI0015524FB9|nr:substrate-binding domain-containing protein [Prevotella sp. PTAC]MCX4293101.1 substrate-binding domain-containing protein [Prevotella sp.]NPD54101.1 substrate-binding domain-containing protein [Prevotella sp. PTAC]